MDRTIVEKYIELQSTKVANLFNLDKNKISYSFIKSGRDIKVIDGDEEVVRAYILTKLVNELG